MYHLPVIRALVTRVPDTSDFITRRVRTRGMSHGPHAIGHADGKVIFVRGAAPDEDVEVIVREDRTRFAFADLANVVVPSPARREPPCVYLPRCGGCPWQHLDYAAQLEAKRVTVQEQLRRIGALDVVVAPVIPASEQLGYRHRLKLRVQDRRVGFLEAASHNIVPVKHCLLAMPAVDAAIADAETLVRELRTCVRRIEIVDRGRYDDGVVLVGEAEGDWNRADEAVCDHWLAAAARVHGLVLTGRGWRRAWGDDSVVIHPEEDLSLTLHAGSFTQVNPAMNRVLVSTVLRNAGVSRGIRVLDLYAGAGNFSLACARRGAEVCGVEQVRAAVADARANAEALRLPDCDFRAATACRGVDAMLAANKTFDVVVLDPPRSGAADVIAGLLKLAAPRLVYVSCNPSSLARDLKLLSSRYVIEAVQPIDMFPHSYHVEIVVAAKLAC